ncbi:MAG: acyl-CoA dehydrogenase [Rhodospirillales bacterium]|nr:acyl-CoA dehydrogenase [Rhodospirillales bacterium]
MTSYAPPLKDMRFILESVIGFRSLLKSADLDSDMVSGILEAAALVSTETIAPLNAPGDRAGCGFEGGAVTMPPGFRAAYRTYCEGGWNAVPFDPAHGGQGLPWALAFAIQEMWQGASLAFGLCPLLNQGAVEAISAHADEDLKKDVLPHLISGLWTGTMNLTESQAGSDLSAIRALATACPDGTWSLTGQKIFITYGEHDLSENIIHLVLARTEGAPEGIRGLSLFCVPKTLPDGTQNSVTCAGLEHKLGIHASPTCTMVFDGAQGRLVGDLNAGLKCMFTMMNNARLSVGLQGVAIAERALQAAVSYAKERVQGSLPQGGARIAILGHPDIRRILLSAGVQIEAMRALTYYAAFLLDRAEEGDADSQSLVDLLTPVVKAWGTEIAVEVSSAAIQVHGGMGYIEETGVPQFYRDARILPIYEGTNGIQSVDLVFRKIMRDEGKTARRWIAQARAESDGFPDLAAMLDRLEALTGWVLDEGAAGRMDSIAASCATYLKAFGVIAGGVMMARSARAARALGDDPAWKDFSIRKIKSTRFYNDNILPRALGLIDITRRGAESTLAFSLEDF